MNLNERREKSPFIALVAIISAILAAGCGQQTNQGGINSAISSANSDNSHLSRFTPIKPDAAQARTYKYKVYEFADDGSWISIVPMSPKSGDVSVGINVSGSYTVKLTNEKCASAVSISPSVGSPFALTSSDSQHNIEVSKGTQLKITMADTAPNNYFCNVAVSTGLNSR